MIERQAKIKVKHLAQQFRAVLIRRPRRGNCCDTLFISRFLNIRSNQKSNYLVTRSLRSRERGEVVHFSGKARKMNHISLFCERSELWAK
ncbi:MAG: hypothetical protein U5L45_00495 [Saprospiraceae bacterium]|nr:hypothetical protein [Saprospiraceae bacterium]